MTTLSNYQFDALNDKEFESLCCDVIGTVENKRIDRYKPGKDKGVDGRFFSDAGKEVVIQCKHYSATPLSGLLYRLRNEEIGKVRKLNPSRYIFATSLPLSLSDKQKIITIMSPYILNTNDVYGRENLIDILDKNQDIERRHFKLWLCSFNVLSTVFNKPIFDRSYISMDEISDKVKIYCKTQNHDTAIAKLDKQGVIIISGDPGIGKTTLAEQICLLFVVAGFEYFKIEHSTEEAESVWENEKRQIFYFDDFLGRNYLDAVGGREDSRIVAFIKRVRQDKTFCANFEKYCFKSRLLHI